MVRRLLPVLLLASCVVRYGDGVDAMPAEPLPPPVDFAEVETRLGDLIRTEEDHDRIDRLRAALDLARRMKTQDPRAQGVALTYLKNLVTIEERAQPVEAPSIYGEATEQGFTPLQAPVIEEEVLGLEEPAPEEPAVEEPASGLSVGEQPAAEDSVEEVPATEGSDGEEPASADPVDEEDASGEWEVEESADEEPVAEESADEEPLAEAPGAAELAPQSANAAPGPDNIEALVGQARWMMDEGNPLGAATALQVCKGRACWTVVEPQYIEARDAYVKGKRDGAAERFITARAQTEPVARRKQLEAVRLELAELADRFPDSPHIDAIRRNLALVVKELEAAPAP